MSATLKTYPSLKSLSSEIGSVLLVSISLTIFWELSTKRDFFAEIMHHVQLSENIKQAGVKSGLRYVEWAAARTREAVRMGWSRERATGSESLREFEP